MFHNLKSYGAAASLALLSIAAPTNAKDHKWTPERYSQCLQREGQDVLDLVESINTNSCRKGRMAIIDSDYPVGHFDVAANVAASRDKQAGSDWAVFATFRIEISSTKFYGGAYFLNQASGVFEQFEAASILVNGTRVELPITSQERGVPECQSSFRSGFGVTECKFASAVVLNLDSDILEKIQADAQAEPSGRLAVKIFTASMRGVTLGIPYSEIIAVQNATK